jgi:hypothetical protein
MARCVSCGWVLTPSPTRRTGQKWHSLPTSTWADGSLTGVCAWCSDAADAGYLTGIRLDLRYLALHRRWWPEPEEGFDE